ncbi:unnamed protein product [Alternaria alternata]
MIVLKPLKQALADGDQVFGVIPGSSTNQGGLSASLTVTQPSAQVSLYQSILKRAGMSPNHVSYVEAHGTGTQAGDPLEIHAESGRFGFAGVLKVIAMLQKKAISTPRIIAIAKTLEEWEVPFKAAWVNNYGAAGSNASLVVYKYASPAGTRYPIILSAPIIESLKAYAESRRSYNQVERILTLLVLLTRYLSDASVIRWPVSQQLPRLQACRTAISATIRPCNITPSSKPVVLAFSGQSKQTVDLSKTLATSPSLTTPYTSRKCERILVTFGCPSIIPAIFQTPIITDPVLLQAKVPWLFNTQALNVGWMPAFDLPV